MIQEKIGYGYDSSHLSVNLHVFVSFDLFSLLVLCVSFPMLTELMFECFL